MLLGAYKAGFSLVVGNGGSSPPKKMSQNLKRRSPYKIIELHKAENWKSLPVADNLFLIFAIFKKTIFKIYSFLKKITKFSILNQLTGQ